MMKSFLVFAVLLLAMPGVADTVRAGTIRAGGYGKASTASKEVRDAARYAIEAQAGKTGAKTSGAATKLELVKILGAQKQVVAGINYRLKLQVKVNGMIKEADVVVWWQAWRKPEPYRLTYWKWDQS